MHSRPVAITMGDPAGIGPEIAAMLFRRRPEWSGRCFVVGDLGTLRRAALLTATAGGPLPLAVLESPENLPGLPPGCLPVLPLSRSLEPSVPFGQVSAQAGEAAAAAIEWAARAALRAEVSAVVTAPIHKEALAAAGRPYPGHTEFLQALAAEHHAVDASRMPVRMMLSNPDLRTVLHTIHVPLRTAIEALTIPSLLQTIQITAAHFERFFPRPDRPCRIGVAGLNPHAGEGGLLGREEIEVVAPAVALARAEGLDVFGPEAPDTIFMRARRGACDVVIALYHDQGLIPVKLLGLDSGVNTTLGLPFVRTSPDHGTAFDLAGKGLASPDSLCAAVEAAMCYAPQDREPRSSPLE
ncbi:MAG: 4-hydroxythreonine-4-phosphate dehydrogenase PdxA [Serpentinimonas sp.]|jgi:4-hydroxythreonine-4-phosphate dehydrogenase|nr:4-hydroxythreonine-4-phosphate dehydrogenase PdxA [Serpentinimonas sp.]